MKNAVCALVLLLALTTPVLAQAATQKPAHRKAATAAATTEKWPTVQDVTFHSASLGRDMHYRILLPADYAQSTRRYPVVYLLHGLYGSHENWETRTNVVKYARALPIIIVMPDAGDSWYVNSATQPQDRYEDYIIKDLLTEVENRFRVLRLRSARMIAGLSMGGYGALKFALKNPQTFGMAASMSGAFNAPAELGAERPDFAQKLQEVFGELQSAARTDNDLLLLIAKQKPGAVPYLYIDCGTADYFLAANRRVAAALAAQHVAYEYHELPGIHDWEFWNRQVESVLSKFAGRAMAESKLN
ncbi:MAG TPA: alpha/beta hydrolase family protein [Terriglobales bacterium]|nr:alpha/beta hydrolase family protein [Terriglobales bacterium]